MLECELAMHAERRKCKKVIAWSVDFGIDKYVSWNLTNEKLTLDVIWEKFEEVCKPQCNEVSLEFDLLTSFRQGERSVNEWYNALQTQVALTKYPQETAKILYRDIFCFFFTGMRKTVNDSNIELNKLPASKVRQLAKKMEIFKTTAKYINQVTCNPQATQINLMCQQCTELPSSTFKRKSRHFKSRQENNKQHYEEKQRERMPQVHKKYDNYERHTCQERYSKCSDSQHKEGFKCPASKHQCEKCHKYGHFSSLCYKKRVVYDKRRSLESRSPKHINF